MNTVAFGDRRAVLAASLLAWLDPVNHKPLQDARIAINGVGRRGKVVNTRTVELNGGKLEQVCTVQLSDGTREERVRSAAIEAQDGALVWIG